MIPDDLLVRAQRQPNGELLWRPDDAAELIRILAAGGCRVPGIDLHRGGLEMPAYVSDDEVSIEDAAAWALNVLEQEAQPSDRVLVTWEPRKG